MFKTEKRHTIDVLFVITLFCVFALSVIAATAFGAKVYRNIVDDMDGNFNSRTSYTYLINKIHQSDAQGLVSVGAYEGLDALIISEEIDNIIYNTYLYYYDGSLRELFTRSGQSFDPAFGTELFKLESFEISDISDTLIKVVFTPYESEESVLFVHIRSTK